MPLVRYTENKNQTDPVGALRLVPDENGVERVLEKGGDPLEVTDAELADLSRRYVLEDLDDSDDDSEDEKSTPAPAQSGPTTSLSSLSSTTPSASSQSGASSPSTPGQGS